MKNILVCLTANLLMCTSAFAFDSYRAGEMVLIRKDKIGDAGFIWKSVKAQAVDGNGYVATKKVIDGNEETEVISSSHIYPFRQLESIKETNRFTGTMNYQFKKGDVVFVASSADPQRGMVYTPQRIAGIGALKTNETGDVLMTLALSGDYVFALTDLNASKTQTEGLIYQHIELKDMIPARAASTAKAWNIHDKAIYNGEIVTITGLYGTDRYGNDLVQVTSASGEITYTNLSPSSKLQ